MRFFLIEKKVAARYEAADPSLQHQPSESQQNGNTNDEQENSADEESPLLPNGQKKEDTNPDYLVHNPETQPALIRKIPIFYCLSSGSLILAQLTALVQATVIASFDATVPTHVSDLYNFSSLQASLVFIPLAAVNLVFGPVGGYCVDRYGTKPVAVVGFAYLVPILACLRIPQDSPYPRELIIFCLLMGLAGFGMAVIGSPSIVEAGAVVDKFHKQNKTFFGEQGPYAQLYAINSMVFCLGLSVGPVVGGGLKDAIGYGNMNAVLAAISGVTAIGAYIWLGGRPAWLRRKVG